MRPASLDGPVIKAVVTERRSVRAQNPAGRPEALGLPAEHPPVHSFLGVPIASPSRVYGWITLRNKLGAEEFSDADEQAAALGSHAGIAYENVRLIEDLHRRLSIQDEDRRRALARAREEECSRLARLLHDRLGQAWTGLKMDLHWLGAKLAAAPNRPVKDVTDKVESMMRHVEETIVATRDIANELRPAVLDRLGLLAGIEWQGEEFERRSGIRCRVNMRVEHVDLDLGRSTLVFRIVQEALTNVFQHARATRATISVRGTARRLTVSVADNGRGIPSDRLISDDSLGFVGMREHAALLGGRLEVRKGRPNGTRIMLIVPLPDRRLALRDSS